MTVVLCSERAFCGIVRSIFERPRELRQIVDWVAVAVTVVVGAMSLLWRGSWQLSEKIRYVLKNWNLVFSN